MKTETEKQPPSNTKRVYSWADLLSATEPRTFLVSEPGQEPREITVAKHKRQVLEGLMHGPIYAASYCRISDQVLLLRRDEGVSIRCDMYSNDPETGRKRYGVYVLESEVAPVDDVKVAA